MRPKLMKRILSAAILAPIFLGVIIWGALPLKIWLMIAFCLSVNEWFNVSKLTKFFIPVMLVGSAYIYGAYTSFYILRDTYSLSLILLFLIMIWSSDIGAYFVGKTIGGAKLIPSVSPNKTWAGFGGALGSPALVGVIWIFTVGITDTINAQSLPLQISLMLVIGVITGLSGQAGDLIVSALKRQAGVKDTGNLIPGHGGLLDRIDSMLLAAPVFLGLIMLTEHFL